MLLHAYMIAMLTLLLAASAQAAPVPGELRLLCDEQPATRVVVGKDGQIASEQVPASAQGSIQVQVINLEHRDLGPNIPARIDSSDDALDADPATWQPGDSVGADDGRLRLDLTDNSLYLLTPELGNQGLFRRFSCRTETGAAEQMHYRCGPAFELWVSFTGHDDKRSAKVLYTGGSLELPQVESGSGARYEKDGNTFWTKGDEALFQLSGSEEHRCQKAD